MGNKKKPVPRRNTIVDILIILFGVSSWVAVNGLWVELPVLVLSLPEGWRLASYIVITSQLANLGPILFSIARRVWSQKILEVPLIHISLIVVIAGSALLSVFWDRTTFIGGELHSTALLVLTFLLAFVDCTSSLLYLPFIANFKEHYVISYMVGAGLSGPIPGILALGQGIGGNPDCINVTTINVTEFGNMTINKTEPYYPPPRFSANIFFGVLCVQMIISWIAFILLNALPQAQNERATLVPVIHPPNPVLEQQFQSSTQTDFSSSMEKTISSEINFIGTGFSKFKFYILLALQCFVCALHNGVLLSIQTYSCMPYGNLAFHLAVTLSSIANPICCFFAMYYALTSVISVTFLTMVGSVWAAYILATAVLSPIPPLVDHPLGPCLVILSWIMVSGTTAYVKACIAAIMRREGGQFALYLNGIVTQVGSATGAIVAFSLVQFTTVFHSYSPCN